MLTEMRDTIGLLLLGLGIDISTITTFDEAVPAFEKLEEAKDSGQIRAFHGDDYLDDLSSGNFAVCDRMVGRRRCSSAATTRTYGSSSPRAERTRGPTRWSCRRAPANRDAAPQWMNFVYDPVEAAQITAWVQYVSPVDGVREELEKIDAELANNPLLFPDDATLAHRASPA